MGKRTVGKAKKGINVEKIIIEKIEQNRKEQKKIEKKLKIKIKKREKK